MEFFLFHAFFVVFFFFLFIYGCTVLFWIRWCDMVILLAWSYRFLLLLVGFGFRRFILVLLVVVLLPLFSLVSEALYLGRGFRFFSGVVC